MTSCLANSFVLAYLNGLYKSDIVIDFFPPNSRDSYIDAKHKIMARTSFENSMIIWLEVLGRFIGTMNLMLAIWQSPNLWKLS